MRGNMGVIGNLRHAASSARIAATKACRVAIRCECGNKDRRTPESGVAPLQTD
jgi:hypothetical protein